MDDVIAQRILETAIAEGRSGELLDCLFDGGGCTVDAVTRKLVLIKADQFARFTEEADTDA